MLTEKEIKHAVSLLNQLYDKREVLASDLLKYERLNDTYKIRKTKKDINKTDVDIADYQDLINKYNVNASDKKWNENSRNSNNSNNNSNNNDNSDSIIMKVEDQKT